MSSDSSRQTIRLRKFKPGEFLSGCFSAREFGLYLAVEVDAVLQKLAILYDNFPEEFWVCGVLRKEQLEKWLDEFYQIIEDTAIFDSSNDTVKTEDEA